MKKYLKKLFLITSILLLTFSLNGVFASITANTKTRLNKVIKKVSIKDDDKRKSFLILLVNLKSKYKDSSDIEGMINYLENNVCAKSTYTQTKINTAINDIITKFKNEGYEKIKTEIIAGIKLLEANPYNAIGVRCQVALYDNINENKIFGKYERGYLVEADIDNYMNTNITNTETNTTTTDIVDTTTETTTATENKCKEDKDAEKGSCYVSNSAGEAFITKSGQWCYKSTNTDYYIALTGEHVNLGANPEINKYEVYCENDEKKDYTQYCKEKDTNYTCTNGGFVSKTSFGESPTCKGNRFLTTGLAKKEGVFCGSKLDRNNLMNIPNMYSTFNFFDGLPEGHLEKDFCQNSCKNFRDSFGIIKDDEGKDLVHSQYTMNNQSVMDNITIPAYTPKIYKMFIPPGARLNTIHFIVRNRDRKYTPNDKDFIVYGRINSLPEIITKSKYSEISCLSCTSEEYNRKEFWSGKGDSKYSEDSENWGVNWQVDDMINFEKRYPNGVWLFIEVYSKADVIFKVGTLGFILSDAIISDEEIERRKKLYLDWYKKMGDGIDNGPGSDNMEWDENGNPPFFIVGE